MGRFDHLEIGDARLPKVEITPGSNSVIDQDYYLAVADEAFNNEDYEKALSLYSRMLQYDEDSIPGWLGQIRSLIELGELQEAIVWSKRILDKQMRSAPLLAARAVAESRTGNKGIAIGYSDSAMSGEGLCAYVWLSRGEVLINENIQNAKLCFDKALTASGQDWKYHFWTALAYMKNEYYHQAQEHLKYLVGADPQRYCCWYRLGQCCDMLGEIDEAKIAFRRSLAANPKFYAAQAALTELDSRGVGGHIADALKRLFKRGK